MHVVAAVPERADGTLIATADALWSATPHVLTRWNTADGLAVAHTVSSEEPRPGPLADLRTPGMVGWGPTVVPTSGGQQGWSAGELIGAALSDVGEDVHRWYQLKMGAVSADGRRAAVTIVKQRSRARADRARTPPGPDARTVVIHLHGDAEAEVVVDGHLPTCLAWARDALVLGLPGVAVRSTGSLVFLDPDDRTYPSVLAVTSHALAAAGTPDGRILVIDADDASLQRAWIAHHAVRSLAWHADGGRLVSGGDDGTVRVWQDADEVDRYEGHAAIVALACLPTGAVVAKTGGVDGSILLLT